MSNNIIKEVKIYTSWFGNVKKLHAAGIVPIGIAVKPPGWYSGHHMKALAPRGDMLRMSPQRYVPEFNAILHKLDPTNVVNRIVAMTAGRPAALLCFEKPGDFCHRRLVAQWLYDNLLITVDEWSDKPQGPPPPTLFD